MTGRFAFASSLTARAISVESPSTRPVGRAPSGFGSLTSVDELCTSMGRTTFTGPRLPVIITLKARFMTEGSCSMESTRIARLTTGCSTRSKSSSRARSIS
jgi:hypothetical protein